MARNVRLAMRYALGAFAFTLAAWALRPLGGLFLWPATALTVVAIAYAGAGASVFRKRDGRLPISSRILLAPYLLVVEVVHAHWRRNLPPWVAVAPNVLIGRRLSRVEAAQLRASGIVAVLDLSVECDEEATLRTGTYLNIGILDFTEPTSRDLEHAVNFIQREVRRGTVFVHCALGLSRSARVAAAYLQAERLVEGEGDAIAALRRAQPRIVLAGSR